MSENWIIDTGTERLGPHSLEELRDLAVRGQLLPEHRLWHPGLPKPIAASEVGGLFAQQIDLPAVPPIERPSSQAPPPLPFPTKLAKPDKSATQDAKPQDSESEIIFRAATPPPLPFPSTPPSTTAVTKANDLLKTVKAAGEWSIKQAERTALQKVTLPAAYCSLGKNCYKSQEFRSEFADLYQTLDAVRDQLATLAKSSEGTAAPQSLGDKTKATAAKAMQAAQSQKLKLKLTTFLGALGKSVYDKRQETSGPEEVVRPIRETLARIASLDAEIAGLSETNNRPWITPKRLVLTCGLAAAVSAVVALARTNIVANQIISLTSVNSDEQQVKTLKAMKETAKVTESIVKNRVDQLVRGEEPAKESRSDVRDADSPIQSDRKPGAAPEKPDKRNHAADADPSSPDFSKADYSFDFSQVNYSPVDFESLDYSKGPNGEIIEELYGDDNSEHFKKHHAVKNPMRLPFTQQGYVRGGNVTKEQAKWAGLRQPELQKALQNRSFVPHGYRWVWFRANAPEKPNSAKERVNQRQGSSPPSYSEKPVVMKMVEQWFHGELHGRVTVWSDPQGWNSELAKRHDIKKESVKIVGDHYMVHGQKCGKSLVCWENGEKQIENWWFDGALHGPAKEWYANGQLQSEGVFVNGKPHGKYIYWQENGELAEEQAYVRGVKHGVFRMYHYNGQKGREVAFVDGKEASERREWSEYGKDMRLVREENKKLYGTDPKGFTRKILIAEMWIFTKQNINGPPRRKDVVASHDPGTVADLLQALQVLGGHDIRGVRSSEINNAYGAFSGLRCNPELWKRFFGAPQGVYTMKLQFTKEYWHINCNDGKVRFVGNIMANPPLVAVDAVHWDDYIPEYCSHK